MHADHGGENGPLVHTAPGRRVEVTPSRGQSAASVKADLARSDDLAARLVAEGVQSWRSYYRWLGPVKVKVAKEVGPPPWRWPRIGVWRWDNGVGFSALVGWRSTAYRLFVLWAGRASQSIVLSEREDPMGEPRRVPMADPRVMPRSSCRCDHPKRVHGGLGCAWCSCTTFERKTHPCPKCDFVGLSGAQLGGHRNWCRGAESGELRPADETETHLEHPLWARVRFLCTVCAAPMGECDCWVECSCGWTYGKHSQCRNPDHLEADHG